VAQAVIVYAVSLLMGIRLSVAPAALVAVLIAVLLGSAVFSTFSLVIACIVKTRERFMGIGQLLTMPLFFASNALYPLEAMPGWLRVVAHVNPLTYLVDALRTTMIQVNGAGLPSLGTDAGVLLGVLLVLVVMASRLYPTVIR
jgi:ABC-2 type transport system permease protein